MASTVGRWMMSMLIRAPRQCAAQCRWWSCGLGRSGQTARLGRYGVVGQWLLGVELHDELLLHRLVDVLTQRQREHPDLESVPDRLQPRRQLAIEGVHVAADVEQLAGRGLQ